MHSTTDSPRPAITAIIFTVLVSGALFAGSPVNADEATEGREVAAPADGVVVFYFHGNVRCATCRKIEAYADEAVRNGFAAQLGDGTLTWHTVNIDEPEHKHFVDDFQLVTRSVVLVEYRDGEVVRYENLDKVWQLVRSKNDFVEYVQSETGSFLEGS